MNSKAFLSVLLMLATVLAGCSDSPAPKEETNEALNELELEATDDTGVIKGLVVDAAIRPIEGVTISIANPNDQYEVTSNADGVFGLGELAPGAYQVRATKLGYLTVQQNVEVRAGVDNPDAVRILMEVNPDEKLYIGEYKFDGFIECSFSVVAVGYAACDSVPESNDEFMVEYIPDKKPTWAQSEMIWDNSQSVSTELTMAYSADLTDAELLDNWVDVGGESPLLGVANTTLIDEVGLGVNIDLMIRIFNEANSGTNPQDIASDPVDGDDCWDRPALGGCLRGAGATVQQEFTIYTHLFYGYTPGDWRFSSGTPPPTA